MSLPLFPLKTVLLPQGALELRIFEPRYQHMLEDCLNGDKKFGVVFYQNGDDELGSLRPVGCLATIIETIHYEDGTARLLIEGGARFRVDKLDITSKPYYFAKERVLEEVIDLSSTDPILSAASAGLMAYRRLLEEVDSSMLKDAPPRRLRPEDSYHMFDQLLLPEEKRQTALELTSARSRFELGMKYLQMETARLKFLLANPEDAGEVH